MNRADKKEYMKAYYQAHREERKAYMKAWYQSNREERKAWYQANREERKAYQKAYRGEHKDYIKAYKKAHREEYNGYQKAYTKLDTNSLGQTKQNVRVKSSYYLFNVLKHFKIDGYEIHHCFGYDDYRHFIYIPKALHLQIHQFLRDNNVDADSNHYAQIEHIIINYYKHNDKHFLVL